MKTPLRPRDHRDRGRTRHAVYRSLAFESTASWAMSGSKVVASAPRWKMPAFPLLGAEKPAAGASPGALRVSTLGDQLELLSEATLWCMPCRSGSCGCAARRAYG